jgi:uncharacterized membrane protein
VAALLSNFRNTVILSVVLALLVAGAYFYNSGSPQAFGEAMLRMLHVFSGILWIGLLYYFNFVQIRKMPEIPAEQKPAVSKYIAPEALFWFRWAALATWVFGVALAAHRGYLLQAATLGATEGFKSPQHLLIGFGMWLATIMFLNVWGIIWPNQKRALGIVEADADTKARSARIAMLGSRTNMLLSIPMLVTMTMRQRVFG